MIKMILPVYSYWVLIVFEVFVKKLEVRVFEFMAIIYSTHFIEIDIFFKVRNISLYRKKYMYIQLCIFPSMV